MKVAARVRRRIERLLRRQGIGDEMTDEGDPLRDESTGLAGLTAAAVRGRTAFGGTGGSRSRSNMSGPMERVIPGSCRLGSARLTPDAGLLISGSQVRSLLGRGGEGGLGRDAEAPFFCRPAVRCPGGFTDGTDSARSTQETEAC